MKIKEVLKIKGHVVCTVQSSQTIQEAVHLLSQRGIGALLVTDDHFETVVGILSERDIVRGCNISRKPLIGVKVNEWMTRSLVTCSPDDDVQSVMSLMTEHRIRHVPVVEDGEIFGVVSIGDVVKAVLGESESRIHFLQEYAFGAVAN